jgi:hypothetical protein
LEDALKHKRSLSSVGNGNADKNSFPRLPEPAEGGRVRLL